jgi:hypothetical protein
MYRVRTDRYEATVTPEGWLTSLRVGGIEFLYRGGDTARGAYFFREGKGGTLKLLAIERTAVNVITARNEQASVRYEFGPDTLVWDLTNATGEALRFDVTFSPRAVRAVMNDRGELERLPVKQEWQTTTWFGRRPKVTIRNGSRIWGPGEANTQVWEASLGPQETRRVVVQTGTATDAELAKVAAALAAKPAVVPDLAVLSPRDYQVFQRRSRLRNAIGLRGRVRPACDRVEARVTGFLAGDWRTLPPLQPDQTFEGELPANAGGWYRVELRAMREDQVVAQAAVDHVGVGEVFVIAGQSNSTNYGPDKLKTQSGMVATFDGDGWRLADDPQPGVHDRSDGGSCWPAFGDALYARYKVPIGIASTGHAGTSVKEWRAGGEYFRWLTARMGQLGKGGFRAVLWHQGESDVDMPSEEYLRQLTAVIKESKKEAGWDFPWFVAQVSYQGPSKRSFDTTRAAQKKLWETGVALEGPDTDTLTEDNRENGGQRIHFSAKGLRAHGRMWADKVGVYLDKVLDAQER